MKKLALSISMFFLCFLTISLSQANGQALDCSDSGTTNCTWKQFKNSKGSKGNTYTKNAVKVLENGTVLESMQQIVDFHQKENLTVDSIWTVFKTKANDQFSYEIGAFKSGATTYKHLLITTLAESPKRVFEFIAIGTATNSDGKAIDQRRAKWMELCNQHDTRGLVEQLYAEHPLYYNHKPVIATREALITEYGYMENPKYSLELKPEHVESVTGKLAFEIGQCAGSYNGKYILIWQKDDKGVWYVLLDSNI